MRGEIGIEAVVLVCLAVIVGPVFVTPVERHALQADDPPQECIDARDRLVSGDFRNDIYIRGEVSRRSPGTRVGFASTTSTTPGT
jgi:hypothetical protein